METRTKCMLLRGDILCVMSWTHILHCCHAVTCLVWGLIFPAPVWKWFTLLKSGVCVSFCRWLCWTKPVLLLCRHIIKIFAIGVEIMISQSQGCGVLKSQYCPPNDCMQWAYVSVLPSCYMHHNHCLMNYCLSTVCCRRVRNSSLYKFQFNCFSLWWPYFLSKWWGSGKGLVGRFQTLLEKKP